MKQETHNQFIKFCIIGASNTIIDLLLYFLFTRYIGLGGERIYIAKGLSFIIAIFNSFLLNSSWTFKQKGGTSWKKLFLFYVTVGSGIVINIGVHFLNIHFIGMNDMISGLFAAMITAMWGFTWAKYFIFK